MSLKNLKIIEALLRKVRRAKKAWVISRATKDKGGYESRYKARSERLERIRADKKSIRDDLVNAWGLGELKPPTEEEKKLFYLYYQNLSIEYLLKVKKKYWHENI